MFKRLTQEEFISRCQTVWGDKYDLSKAVFTKAQEKVEIVCPKHGSFFPRAYNFWNGHGCRMCSDEKYGRSRPYTTDEFIEKAKAIHGDRYDYSKVVYKRNNIPVEIVCKEHGSFYQKPADHFNGFNCPRCYGNARHTTEEFIQLARKAHGDKYDYSLVEYCDNRSKVEIICPKHGTFLQEPHSHLQGRGCPKCKDSTGEEKVELFLVRNDIKYEREKRFLDCRYKMPLPFDFFLPNKNTCIEFQGPQHYQKTRHFKDSEGAFKSRQLRDQIKRDYCKSKGIRLVEIKYTDNIEKELTKTLL